MNGGTRGRYLPPAYASDDTPEDRRVVERQVMDILERENVESGSPDEDVERDSPSRHSENGVDEGDEHSSSVSSTEDGVDEGVEHSSTVSTAKEASADEDFEYDVPEMRD